MLPKRTTYADYLAAEDTSERRHEFIDGIIIAIAGGSDEHNALSGRVARLLGNREQGACRYYSPDQRFWIEASGRGRYSDGSVICGGPAHPRHDAQATTNPVIVIEVLSPSSEGDDEGDKRRDFQSLTSLRAYVLVAQDERCVRVFRRDHSGTWIEAPDVFRGDQQFELPQMSTAISIAEVYDGILDRNGKSALR